MQINPGTVGFYRIQYSSAMLESLLPGIRDLTLLPVDRLGLQNDLFSLVRRHTSVWISVLQVRVEAQVSTLSQVLRLEWSVKLQRLMEVRFFQASRPD